MLNEYVKSLSLIVPVTVVTMGLETLAFHWMPKTAKSSLVGTLFGFLIFGLGFGFLAIYAWHWVAGRWAENPAQVYLWFGLAGALLFTILAVVMQFAIKSPWRVVGLWTVMNLLWGLSYGWYLPRILG
jgi:hypothetical protein